MAGSSVGYDALGNIASLGGTTYSYSAENMLLSVASGGTTTLAYDPLNRLFYSSASGGTQFDYLGGQLIAEYDSSNTLLRRYLYGADADEPLIWYEGTGTTNRRYLDADERGSIARITDANGNTLATNTYDEYGVPASTNMGRFQYTGQAWLPEASLYTYKARMYSPTLGRFMQTDPIGYADGPNWYNYVGSDPVNAVDPSGLARRYDGERSWVIPTISTDESFGDPALGDPFDALNEHANEAFVSEWAQTLPEIDGITSDAGAAAPTDTDPDNGNIVATQNGVANDGDDAASCAADPNCILVSGQRSTPRPPLPEAQGRPHTVIEEPGPNGRYTTYDEHGPVLQYRGTGKPHGKIPRPNVKTYPRNFDPNGQVRPGRPTVRPPFPEEILEVPVIEEIPIIPL